MSPIRKTYPLLCAVILLTVLLAACSGPQGPSIPSTGTQSAPLPASAGATPTAMLPTLDLTHSATPTVEPTAAASKTYTDPQLGVRFSYPSAWQETSPDHLEGAGGYAWAEIRPNDGAGPGAVCQGEANGGKPEKFGAFPQILDVVSKEGPTACLILPSDDQPATRKKEALYLVWYPAAVRPNALLALHADRDHIIDIAKSLRLIGADSAPTTSRCDYLVDAASAPVRENGLRIDEYPIARSANCIPNLEPEVFNDIAAEGAPATRAKQMIARQWTGASMTQLNKSLARFGFRVWGYDKYYAIYQNGRTVKTKLNWIGPATINASQTDFILPVMDSYNSQIYLLRADGIHALEDWDILTSDRVFSVYVGDDLISAAYDYERYERPVNNPALLTVKKNDQLIDTYSVNGATAEGGPARGLWSWDGHWVLELPGMVIQDGQSLNESLGYSEMFTWRLLKGKPFYFFRKDGQIHMHFDGQEMPVTYDEVIHKPNCCISELLQMQAFENGLTYYARRGDTWYYVVIEAGQ